VKKLYHYAIDRGEKGAQIIYF